MPRGNVRAHADLAADIKEKNAANKVMVYSKSYCPYCMQVIGLFDSLEVQAKIVQLDEIGARVSPGAVLLTRGLGWRLLLAVRHSHPVAVSAVSNSVTALGVYMQHVL